MKKTLVILCWVVVLVILCGIGVTWNNWQNRKRVVTSELVQELREIGVDPGVEFNKSKLDVDDLKFKIWFNVPGEARIIGVFWCEGVFQYTVFANGAPENLSRSQLEEYLSANKSEAGDP